MASIYVPLIGDIEEEKLIQLFNVDCQDIPTSFPKLTWIKGNETNHLCFPIIINSIVDKSILLLDSEVTYKDYFISFYMLSGFCDIKIGNRKWKDLVDEIITRTLFFVTGGKYNIDSPFMKQFLSFNKFNIYDESYIVSTFFGEGYISDDEENEDLCKDSFNTDDLSNFQFQYSKLLASIDTVFNVYSNKTLKGSLPILQINSLQFFDENIPNSILEKIKINVKNEKCIELNDGPIFINFKPINLPKTSTIFLTKFDITKISEKTYSPAGTSTDTHSSYKNLPSFDEPIQEFQAHKMEFLLPDIQYLDPRNKVYYSDKHALRCICLGNISKIPQNYFDLLSKGQHEQAWGLLEKFIWLPFAREWFREESVLQDISKYILLNGEDYFNPIFKSISSHINQIVQTSNRLPINIEEMKELIKRNTYTLDTLDSKLLSSNLKSEIDDDELSSSDEDTTGNAPIDDLLKRTEIFKIPDDKSSHSTSSPSTDLFSCDEVL